MGVYHLMGLGLSPGVVIGPLTYLAHRRSGEVRQREAGQKVGDIQAIILFTTREVLDGTVSALDYVKNPPSRIAGSPVEKGGPMKEVLRRLLCCEWPAISGGRREGTIFWCEVDRRNFRVTYERVVRVVAALAGVGGQGKEIWANLTGGTNVINAAIQLAAMLSGDIARLYYVQAENEAAEKCVRFTAENGYWIELPVMPLATSRVIEAVLRLLSQEGASARDLYSRLLQHEQYWNLIQGISFETFQDLYLRPMWKQGLIAETNGGYTIGPQWEVIRPYQEVLTDARKAGMTIEALAIEAQAQAAQAQRKPWLEREDLPLSGCSG